MRQLVYFLAVAVAVLSQVGCGSIKGRTATEQLLVSDAVDQSIEQIDFSTLADEDVYLDCKYLKAVRGVGFVNAEYIISSLRQQMTVANCRLQENAAKADFIVEVRVGCLGSDCHEVNYGIPGSQALNQTATLIANAPLPSVPEISLAKTDSCRAAAKISLFAYERESRQPIWESGPSQGISLAKSTWILGAGPFQEGDIYEDVEEMQGAPIRIPDVPHHAQRAEFGRPVLSFLKSAKDRFSGVEKVEQILADSESTDSIEVISNVDADDVSAEADVAEVQVEQGSEGIEESGVAKTSEKVKAESVAKPAVDSNTESISTAKPVDTKVVQASATEPVEAAEP